jgi:hypothetical protein
MPENQNENTDDQTSDATSTQGEGEGEGQAGDNSTDEGQGNGPDLGEAGKKAIAAERTKARNEAAKRRKVEQELAALKAAQAAKPAGTDEAVDPKAIAEAARAEARAELLKDRAEDKIELLAAKSFANPEIARRLLASDVDQFVADGKVDTDAIKDALADLLETNPYLAATPAKRFNGTADQGPRGTGKAPDLDHLITQAQKAGDIREQIRLQNLKLVGFMKDAQQQSATNSRT